ncbi:MAG: UvrD-helicase domain-containing protein [Acidobacteriaceae bacterium]
MRTRKEKTALAEVLRFPDNANAANDAEARTQALDTRSSCVVEAPAGSGKTGLLVQRYLKLLGDEGVEQPEEVLAITFTKKATSELRERALEQLERAKRGVAEEGEKAFDRETRVLAEAALACSIRHGWALIERPNRLNIRSIDSVCAEIANSLPLLSGAGGPRTPVEDAAPLYRLAARRTLLQLGGSDAPLHDALKTVLLHRDGNLADCEALIAGMLQTREQWGELLPLTTELETDAGSMDAVRAKLERTLENIVCAGLSRALRTLPKGVLEELTALAARLGVEPGVNVASPIAMCAGRMEPPAAVADHLDHWVALIWLLLKPDGDWRKRHARTDVRFEIPKAEAARLKEMVQAIQSDELGDALGAVLRLPAAKYPDEQWEVAEALFRVLRRALAELRLLFGERGVCDFTELSLAAREALRADEGSSEFVLSAGGTLRHVLVDEMQDTSSGQYELLELLTDSWDGHTQTMFLVGDPKQSIYLFRQARVERFLRTMRERRLGEIGVQPLQLTSNFRSQGGLVGDFNEMFDRIFPRAAADGAERGESAEVPFVEAVAVRDKNEGPGVVWHAEVLAKSDSAKDHAGEEAREIRRIIEQRLAMPLPPERDRPGQRKPWSIAVLGRAKKHLAAVIEEFKRDNGDGPIAYRAIDLDSLDERQEVLDALALTRALLHPADRVAWLAVLHAPWCGLGLADLLALSGEGQDADAKATVSQLVRRRRGLLSGDGRERLDRVWPVLAAAVETRGRTMLATQVERTWRSLGGDAALTAGERDNVVRYLSVLRDAETEENGVDLEVLAARLKRLYAESPVSGEGREPVELLSIHKAKGLEWDLVLVPGLERGSGQPHTVLLNWQEFDSMADRGDSPSVVLAPIESKGTEKDRLSSWLNGIRAQREAAENKRVFYVAATRAREELHLFAAATRTTKGALAKPRYNSLLKACWPAAEQEFEELQAAEMGAPAEVEVLFELEDEVLAIAATEEISDIVRPAAMIQRLPLEFDPLARFREAELHRLPYPAASALRKSAVFERPEGSFAARAFGNVVHRYLQVLAMRLENSAEHEALLRELASWEARLTTSLRGEGLAPRVAAREAGRAVQALSGALSDPVGRWILSPHVSAASERAVATGSAEAQTLQVDRTFVAGNTPLAGGESCIWIVDFKTSEQGSRSDAAFEASELKKYRDQLETYASVRRALPEGELPIRLGLFYPLIPRLIHWASGELADAD